MNSPVVLYQCIQLIFLIVITSLDATRLGTPKLDPLGPLILEESKSTIAVAPVSEDFRTFYYNQTLDHFNYRPESYTTFQQRYVINSKYWGGANASSPILAYLGAEQPLDPALSRVGFLTDNAWHFKALLVYIEHRYYGQSIPFGSREEAMRNASTMGYFNSAQAIADYAEILLHIKEEFQAKNSPVIVIGGSYGGMLASWLRLKYPHVALGALASSSPILYFDDITPPDGYYSVVSRDFREASETCYETIKQSWDVIDQVALQQNGLSILSDKFNTCIPLKSSSGLKEYLDRTYCRAAQYDRPPTYPVNAICNGINGAAFGSDTLSKIVAGVVAYEGIQPCYVNPPTNFTETDEGWEWQRCSEMTIPISHGNNTMFPSSNYDPQPFIDYCRTEYNITPRSHWVTTYYGGHDIKLDLKEFGSNIVFSNGLRDPYSIGGVLEDISNSIVAVYTANGSHCLDILSANETDPEWLITQRKIEVEIIDAWIAQYSANLHE
ncbi:hypothetical protein K2173_014322 [Erythroxylum novogranatense]|uniref:Lysosomal Pro-X carboxypeptidase n=1 Tax=Erythroxylum novogranatense TaxID=1862640 RepID=A0AAV8SE18_9ROSI|nr:hypothetical protein K2173_014322 [Erythroxylum novogranatense]